MPIDGMKRYYAQCLMAKAKRDKSDRYTSVGTYLWAVDAADAERQFRQRWETKADLTIREDAG